MQLSSKQITQIEIIKAALKHDLGSMTDKDALEWALTFTSEVLYMQRIEALKQSPERQTTV